MEVSEESICFTAECDMNRYMSAPVSAFLEGEVMNRYILEFYRALEVMTQLF